MTLNREQRRGAAKVAGSRTDKMGRRRQMTSNDACKLCAYVSSTIIGARAREFILDGEVIDIHINPRLEPPLGVRFPKSAAKRSPCLDCAGVGRVGCPTCHGSGRAAVQSSTSEHPCETCQGNGKLACGKCMGSGINWVKDDFAPLCQLCSQYLMAWIKERENAHITKSGIAPGASRIIIPGGSGQRAAGIILRG